MVAQALLNPDEQSRFVHIQHTPRISGRNAFRMLIY